MNKEEMIKKIRKYQFIAIDLNLYLDNFPENKCALEDYKVISSKLSALMCEYEQKYGPLRGFGSAFAQDSIEWVNSPWPWELH